MILLAQWDVNEWCAVIGAAVLIGGLLARAVQLLTRIELKLDGVVEKQHDHDRRIGLLERHQPVQSSGCA